MIFGLRHAGKKAQSGYTLVELSIVVIIISLLTASGLAVGASMVERAAYIDTRKVIDQLHQSLKDYYVVNGRLPCAARMNVAPGASNFGAETDCAAPAVAGVQQDGGVRIGAVPTRALGLSDSAAGDKFGSRLVYAVTAELAVAGNFGAGNGAIIVRDADNNVVISNAAFFIASPGKDRKGAIVHTTGNASGNACSPSSHLDVHNCTLTSRTFREAPFNNGDVGNRFFDDVIAWAPKFHFMAVDTQSAALWVQESGTQNIFSVGADTSPATTNVGIGTAAPETRLHVDGMVRGSQFFIRGSDTMPSLDALYDRTSNDDFAIGLISEGTSSGSPISNHEIVFMNADFNNPFPDDGLSFVNYGTAGSFTAMRIRGNGNVGIGTTTPTGKLEINAGVTDSVSMLESLRLSRTSSGSQRVSVLHGHGGHYFNMHSATNNAKPVVFNVTTDEADSAYTAGSTRYYFRIRGEDVMRIAPSGNGWIAGTWNEASDMRLKTDIAPLEDVFSRLDGIDGVYFNWNGEGGRDTTTRKIGLLAQEVQKAYPELVTEEDDGYLSVNQSGMVAPLLEAVKQLKKESDALKERLAELEDASPAAPQIPHWIWGLVGFLLAVNVMLWLRRS